MVVAARAVLGDAAAELAEDQHDALAAGLGALEVGQEGVQGGVELRHQARVARGQVGVGVEAAQLAVLAVDVAAVSQVAAEHFRKNGYTNVANVVGGIDAWSQEVDPEIGRLAGRIDAHRGRPMTTRPTVTRRRGRRPAAGRSRGTTRGATWARGYPVLLAALRPSPSDCGEPAHGAAVGLMLPHVVRFNAGHVGELYDDLRLAADPAAPPALLEPCLSQDRPPGLAHLVVPGPLLAGPAIDRLSRHSSCL